MLLLLSQMKNLKWPNDDDDSSIEKRPSSSLHLQRDARSPKIMLLLLSQMKNLSFALHS